MSFNNNSERKSEYIIANNSFHGIGMYTEIPTFGDIITNDDILFKCLNINYEKKFKRYNNLNEFWVNNTDNYNKFISFNSNNPISTQNLQSLYDVNKGLCTGMIIGEIRGINRIKNILSVSEHNELKYELNNYQNNCNDIKDDYYYNKDGIKIHDIINPSKNLNNILMGNEMIDKNYHIWIPSIIKINNNYECNIIGDIPNLNKYKYKNTLYKYIEKLFKKLIDSFELVCQTKLNNKYLRVIIKCYDYNINYNDIYSTQSIKVGLYENIKAVGMYCYHKDNGLIGGELGLYPGMDGNTTDINMNEGVGIVFNNDVIFHKINELKQNNSNNGGILHKKIIEFYLMDAKNNIKTCIDPRNIVINWKYHSEIILDIWLSKLFSNNSNNNGHEFLKHIIITWICGSNKYIRDMTNKFNNQRKRIINFEDEFDTYSIVSDSFGASISFDNE